MQGLTEVEINHYHILNHLAHGGMAHIYLAQQTETAQIVALKLIPGNAEEQRERFRYEVDILNVLSHPHILPIFDYGEQDSWCYLAMPYIEHGTLNDRLKQGPLSLEEAGSLLAQLASALQFTHDQGIIHRDIKPANILMRDDHHLYLADFGLVKRLGEESDLTATDYVPGTPEYMAPELAHTEATPLSDLYALGVLLYQMLTGSVPFKGKTPVATFLKHVRELPEPPSQRNPEIPVEIERVMLQTLEKDPHRRFQSASELSQSYQEALQQAQAAAAQALITAQIALLPPPSITRVKLSSDQRSARSFAPALVLLGILLISLPLLFNHSMVAQSHARRQTTQAVVSLAAPQPTSVPTPTPSVVPTPVFATPTPAVSSMEQAQTATPQPVSVPVTNAGTSTPPLTQTSNTQTSTTPDNNPATAIPPGYAPAEVNNPDTADGQQPGYHQHKHHSKHHKH